MSAIGEMHGFYRLAREIEKRLRVETMAPEEREKLERQMRWFDEESLHAASSARAEARGEMDDERRGDR